MYNKLVRDRIPEIIAAEGRRAEVRVLTEAEYLAALKQKLGEELAEYLKDDNLEELADLMEVVYALAVAKGSSPSELEALRAKKQQERGGFRERLFLISASE